VDEDWRTLNLANWNERVDVHLSERGYDLSSHRYFADAHPTALVFDDLSGSLDAAGRPAWLVPYFDRAPQQFNQATDYADPSAGLANSRTINWMHPLTDIIGALHGARLRIQWLHEHPRVTWRMFSSLVRDEDGLWTWPDQQWLPLALSLRAIAD
jgi:hypothetical protein